MEKVIELSVPVSNREELVGILRTSLGKRVNKDLFDVLKDSVAQIGRDGLILVEENIAPRNEIEIVQGIELDKGYASSYFVNDLKNFEVVYENPYLLVTGNAITSVNQIRDVIEYVKTNNKPLIIVAEEITKEIIWTIIRDDYYKFNENTNYTASMPEDNNFGILDKASIIWNKTNNRFEEKSADYFNKIQPYQYHSRIPKQGIYLYSFALEPEKWYPTGSYNASVIKTSLLLYVNGIYNNTNINTKLIKMKKNPYTFGYLAKVYTKSYNIFSISSGSGGMKYAL
jgi:hypothetical protein